MEKPDPHADDAKVVENENGANGKMLLLCMAGAAGVDIICVETVAERSSSKRLLM